MNRQNRRAAVLAGLCLILVAWTACAATPVSAIRARLAEVAVLRGAFAQEKHLQGFRNPLRSTGVFVLARDQGLIWDTRTPFASRVLMSAHGLRAIESDGSVRELGASGSAQVAGSANALMMALLTGDTEVLAEQFAIEETLLADGGWTLGLVPTSGVMSKLYRRIDIRGDRHVLQVHLEDVNGDSTDIQFLDLRDSPPELSGEEEKLFE